MLEAIAMAIYYIFQIAVIFYVIKIWLEPKEKKKSPMGGLFEMMNDMNTNNTKKINENISSSEDESPFDLTQITNLMGNIFKVEKGKKNKKDSGETSEEEILELKLNNFGTLKIEDVEK